MKTRNWWVCLLLCACASATAWGATFGKAVAIGGHASDVALDESRGVVYVANFTANRVETLSAVDGALRKSVNVPVQPGSLALSPDRRYLLITHIANYQPPQTPFYALTLLDLETDSMETFHLTKPPFGAAFANHGKALVVTSTEFLLFDPTSAVLQRLATIEEAAAKSLPAPPANFPPQIVTASVAPSGDGAHIFGLTDTFRFRYDAKFHIITVAGYTAKPALGPRVVSVSKDGLSYAAAWILSDWLGHTLAQFPHALGLLNVGGHAIDSDSGTIYAQIPEKKGEPPVLIVADSDNLTVRERLSLPENLAGRSVLSSRGNVMYAVSDSGILILPVGDLARQPRIIASAEELLFRTGNCSRQVATQEIRIEDPSGAATDFELSVDIPGVTVTPDSGVTPATVRVSGDPAAYAGRSGTVVGWLKIHSARAVNLPPDVRLLLNVREPDQRGNLVHVPGRLVDIAADPVRDRFYVLRQDKNQVLVFGGSTTELLATLRTGNTPTQMAITSDSQFLLVANDNSQIASVFDLGTLGREMPVYFPPGHYPRSIATSGNAILAACRTFDDKPKIDRVDVATRLATELPSLGVYENKIHVDTKLVSSPNGAWILAAQADGNAMLYDASADTFTIWRKDFDALQGAVAASSYGWFVADNHLLNASLVPVASIDKGQGVTAGAAFLDTEGYLLTVPAGAGPGVVQRVDTAAAAGLRPTRIAEAPPAGAAFLRSLVPLANRQTIVALGTSGFTVLPRNYDDGAALPRIDAVVSAADFVQRVAPGGLISIFGRNLSPVSVANASMPLGAVLGESCLTVNGAPAPLLFISPGQVNAQLPFEAEGNVTLVLHSAGAVSDNFRLTLLPAAPSVFRSGVAGPERNLPTVIRATNNQLATLSNPVHRGDTLVIYLTGMGRTSPGVPTGAAAPNEPLSRVLIEPAVSLGGIELPVSYAGLTPGFAGLYQINAGVPGTVPTALDVPLVISQGTESTTLSVRVVQ